MEITPSMESLAACCRICCRGITIATAGQLPVHMDVPVGLPRRSSEPARRRLPRQPDELLRRTIDLLRLHAPTAYPVIVRSGTKLPAGTDAYCCRRPSRFVIMLGGHLDARSSVEAVVHEWAHARAWNHLHDRAIESFLAGSISDLEFEGLAHDAKWGVEYAHCWRVFTGEVLPAWNSGNE